MYTVLYALYRRDGTSHEQFVDYWRSVHAPIARLVPDLRGFQTIAVSGSEDRLGEEIDGFAKLDFDSREEFLRAEASPEFQAAHEDALRFTRQIARFELDVQTVIRPQSEEE